MSIPLWNVAIGLVLLISPLVWGLVKMFFSLKRSNEKLIELSLKVIKQDELIVSFEDKYDSKFDAYKNSIERRLNLINETVIATKTMVELLIQDKIKR